MSLSKQSNVKTVTVANIDLNLLRYQRDYILEILSKEEPVEGEVYVLEGVVNLLDAILDAGENHR